MGARCISRNNDSSHERSPYFDYVAADTVFTDTANDVDYNVLSSLAHKNTMRCPAPCTSRIIGAGASERGRGRDNEAMCVGHARR